MMNSVRLGGAEHTDRWKGQEMQTEFWWAHISERYESE
jgi:hypothetical protein